SGSGKSTLMNLLGGLDTPSSGRLSVEGRQVSQMGHTELALFRRSTVGMIFQSFNLISSYTALDNVALPLLFAGVHKKERSRRATELLHTVGLEGRARHRPGELSGGEQQRVAIARALMNEPDLVLADEPTGNLDMCTSAEIHRLVAELNARSGQTFVIVTHNEELAAIAHRRLKMVDGKII
ncbi:MAG: ABC transporter ATP-binding protein, partial [bacterium]